MQRWKKLKLKLKLVGLEMSRTVGSPHATDSPAVKSQQQCLGSSSYKNGKHFVSIFQSCIWRNTILPICLIKLKFCCCCCNAFSIGKYSICKGKKDNKNSKIKSKNNFFATPCGKIKLRDASTFFAKETLSSSQTNEGVGPTN